jgi:hypothetical protein
MHMLRQHVDTRSTHIQIEQQTIRRRQIDCPSAPRDRAYESARRPSRPVNIGAPLHPTHTATPTPRDPTSIPQRTISRATRRLACVRCHTPHPRSRQVQIGKHFHPLLFDSHFRYPSNIPIPGATPPNIARCSKYRCSWLPRDGPFDNVSIAKSLLVEISWESD